MERWPGSNAPGLDGLDFEISADPLSASTGNLSLSPRTGLLSKGAAVDWNIDFAPN